MAHFEQQEFVKYAKLLHPFHFMHVKVLDIGSQDINGSNRDYFDGCDYIGLDLCEGKNVDVVCHVKDFESPEQFDTIISTEALEHDKDWPLTFQKSIDLLKSGGLFVMTCAAECRPEHGTTRTSPQNSPGTTDYYMNLSEKKIREVIDIESNFSTFEFQERKTWPQDLYFWGIKK